MRVCQFRHFGKSDSDAAIVAPPSRRVIFYSIVDREAVADGRCCLGRFAKEVQTANPYANDSIQSTESLDK
ncbi:MAG: hypothetical protein DMG84_07165 [Acidobacteria bacterium]|nr:MAG: hypothetical protein DMG85_02395 [Acidobacteriota bacterium]PYX16519.1 MAG: hypothetical protein DMG84_07165 [Acidobacteriota bacterium]